METPSVPPEPGDAARDAPPAAPAPRPPVTLRSAMPWIVALVAALVAVIAVLVAIVAVHTEAAPWWNTYPNPGRPTAYAFTIAIILTALLTAGFGWAANWAVTSLRRTLEGAPPPGRAGITWEPTAEERERILSHFLLLRSPLTMLTAAILVAVLLVFLANLVVPGNQNLLNRLHDPEYARGIITYLFSVGTIGVILLVVFANLAGLLHDKQYDNAKTFVSLLLGLFGTIVGFYYGQATHADDRTVTASVEVADLQITAIAADSVVVAGVVTGGRPPYSAFVLAPDRTALAVDEAGNFSDTLRVAATAGTGTEGDPSDAGGITLRFEVHDTSGQTFHTERVVELKGAAAPEDGEEAPPDPAFDG